MKPTRIWTRLFPLTLLAPGILLAVTTAAADLGTAFGYQGRLNEDGRPANGLYDLRFSLYGEATGGAALGQVERPGTGVDQGAFNVTLDFGAGAFNGDARWLEIQVRTNGTATFATLAPRQALTPFPYALHAGEAGTALTAATADLAEAVAPGAVASSALAAGAVTADKIAAGQAVKSLNGLKDDVALVAGTAISLATNGNRLTISTHPAIPTPIPPEFGGLGFDLSGARSPGSLLHSQGLGTWGLLEPGVVGDVLKIGTDGLIWAADAAGGGTVTSVGAGLGLTGGPITDNGVLSLDPAVVPLLASDNVFRGVNRMTNANNAFNGRFTGDGAGLSNVTATTLSAPVPAALLTSVPADRLTGTIPDPRLSANVPLLNAGKLADSVLSGNVVLVGNNQTVTGAKTLDNPANSFTGNGSGLTGLNAAQLKTGTIPDSRLPSDLARVTQVWLLGGNAGTTPGTHFVGTTDDQPLELKANGARVARLEPQASGWPNVILGSPANRVGAGSGGATVAGGHYNLIGTNVPMATIGGGQQNTNEASFGTVGGGGDNSVQGHGGTIGGGIRNWIGAAEKGTIGGGTGNAIATNSGFATVGGGVGNKIGENSRHATIGGGDNNVIRDHSPGATIPGGQWNEATGPHSFAAGWNAKASHAATFVWADQVSPFTRDSFTSTGTNQFLIRAKGGVGINTNHPAGAALNVGGVVRATAFQGDGSGLTGLALSGLGGGNIDSAVNFISPLGVGIGTANPVDARLDVEGDIRLNDHALWLRGGADRNHGLRWYSSNTFAYANPDGPVLFGCAGGALGSACEGEKLALTWNYLGNVNLDPQSLNAGALLPGLTFGPGSGEGIASKRTPGPGQWGLDFYTQFTRRMTLANNGDLAIQGVLDTLANPALELRLGGLRALRLENAGDSALDDGATPDGAPNVVGGSPANSVTTGIVGATVAGGGATNFWGAASPNTVAADYSTIGGGLANRIQPNGLAATIAGGRDHDVGRYSHYSVIGGGFGNTVAARSEHALIAGGSSNGVGTNSNGGTIGGGLQNLVQAPLATVPGGYQAKATHYGQFAYASGRLAQAGDAQTSLYVLRRQTDNAAPTELFLDGARQRLTVPPGSTWTFEILVVARSQDEPQPEIPVTQHAGYRIQGVVYNMLGTLSVEGLTRTVLFESDATWDVSVTVDAASGALALKVTGSASKSIRWVASVRTAEVSFPQ